MAQMKDILCESCGNFMLVKQRPAEVKRNFFSLALMRRELSFSDSCALVVSHASRCATPPQLLFTGAATRLLTTKMKCCITRQIGT